MPSVAEIYASMDYGPAPESAQPALDWIASHGHRFTGFVENAWLPFDGEASFETFAPASGQRLAVIGQSTPAEVDRAVQVARTAQPGWASQGGYARARHLYALARTVQRNARLLAVLETLDNGKPIRETRDVDVPLVARHFLHHAAWAQHGDRELGFHAGSLAEGAHVPVGVVGQIIPWNFPLLMLAWKVAPALAAGNTVVLKPAEDTTLTALLFCELARAAGLPPGVLNVVVGAGEIGAHLAAHPGVDKIAFTGSTEVGRAIRRATAGQGKALTLELGGKSPFIVLDDADLDSAVEGLVDAIWFNQGQVCCAGSRLLVQESVAEAVLAKVRARMQTLRVGDPLDKCIDIGAIVSPVQRDRIAALVRRGVEEGASCFQPEHALPRTGCFYPPTLLANVQPSHTVAQTEIFGPVLVAMTFRTPDEAVALANNTAYGLAASVWSESVSVALDVAPRLAAGVVWVNTTNVFDAACGFGGVRESGFGREGGREGMLAYVEPAFLRTLPEDMESEIESPRLEAPIVAAGTIDRTAKLYIGGKQRRPDSGYSRPVFSPKGERLGDVGEGSRKDIRDAVEAARAAEAWAATSSHARAQIVYYVAENLDARAAEFSERIDRATGVGPERARRELDRAVERLFFYAGAADTFEGRIHTPPGRQVTLAMIEPVGVIGIVAPERDPLLAFVSLLAPAIATGNRVAIVPSRRHPLVATDFYQVLETSDVPAGVVNLVTGDGDALAEALAAHDDVDAVWYVGTRAGSRAVELHAAGNMKRTWVNDGRVRDWFSPTQGEGDEFLHQATQTKNVWVPYGA